MRLIAGTTLLWLCAAFFSPALAQQFNSDNYLSKPHGVATLIITTGEQTTMFMTTLSLFPRWELTAAAYLYNRDEDRTTGEGYSGSVYAKYMIHENQAKTGGIAFKFGRVRRVGLCRRCRYDRAGLAADALCPECGAEPKP